MKPSLTASFSFAMVGVMMISGCGINPKAAFLNRLYRLANYGFWACALRWVGMLDDGKPIEPPFKAAFFTLRFMDCLGVGLLALGWLLGLALGLSFGSEGFSLGGLALHGVGLRLPALGLALCPSSILSEVS